MQIRPRRCFAHAGVRGFLRGFVAAYLAAALLGLMWISDGSAAGPFGDPFRPYQRYDHSRTKSLVKARVAYLWGFNEIRLRDGDNPNFTPMRRELNVDSVSFGLLGSTFVTDSVGLRAQAWISVPNEGRNDMLFDNRSDAWDSHARALEADLGLLYLFNLGPMPYSAGLIGGYRYANFDYKSISVHDPSGTFHDHLHMHVPYLGVYYSHTHFVGTSVRLDILASPFILSRYDGEENRFGTVARLEGHSVTGLWFESLFGWHLPLSESLLAGIFARYNYIELSGGATVKRDVRSTRFSMDSTHHLIYLGLNAAYAF